MDEAQAVKNATTERAKALRALDAEWRLALTGTPVENHLGEIWSVLRVISPGLLGSWEQFRGRFAVPIEKFGDDARRKALAALLRPFVLRRTKAEVARELPARTEIVRVGAAVARGAGAVRAAAQGDRRRDGGGQEGPRSRRRRPALRAAGRADAPAPALLPPAPGLPAHAGGFVEGGLPAGAAERAARGRPQGAGLQPVPQLPRPAAPRACANTASACWSSTARPPSRRASSGSPPSSAARPTSS